MTTATDRRADRGSLFRARPLHAAAALGAIMLVSSCGELNLREELGITRKGPDEFKVIRNRPLQMPDQLAVSADALPEPQPGAPSLVEPRPALEAQAALTGRAPSTTGAAPTASESALLRQAGATGASDSIRGQMTEEADSSTAEEARLLDSLFGRAGPASDPLQPEDEARRLAEEARQGKNPGLEPLPEPEAE